MENGVFLSVPVSGVRGGRKVPPSLSLLPCPQAAHAGSSIKGNLPCRAVSAPGMSAPARHGIFASPGAYSTGGRGGRAGLEGGRGEDSQPAPLLP